MVKSQIFEHSSFVCVGNNRNNLYLGLDEQSEETDAPVGPDDVGSNDSRNESADSDVFDQFEYVLSDINDGGSNDSSRDAAAATYFGSIDNSGNNFEHLNISCLSV